LVQMIAKGPLRGQVFGFLFSVFCFLFSVRALFTPAANRTDN
jgi:hypothetical protein